MKNKQLRSEASITGYKQKSAKQRNVSQNNNPQQAIEFYLKGITKKAV